MSFSNDIILNDKEIYFYFKYLNWDSGFFDRPSYLLDISKSSLKVSDAIKKDIKKLFNGAFITIKISTDFSNELLDFFQDCGFKYIDTEIVLEYKEHDNLKKLESDIYIDKIEINIDLPYQELGSSFNLTRFHSDINISNKKADALWVQYIRNYTITPMNHIFIAKQNNSIVGAIIVNLIDDIAYIFFIGIIDNYRSLGIGTKLITEVTNYFNKYTIRTGTQVKNINALNFYIKNCFSKINQTNTVLHYWH